MAESVKPSAFAVEVTVATGGAPEWSVVHVQQGWDVAQLLRHISVLQSVPITQAFVPRLNMIRLHSITQLLPDDMLVVCNSEHLLPNKVVAFGANNVGQLGLGATTVSKTTKPKTLGTPKVVKSLACRKVVSISCGRAHTMVLSSDGLLRGFGSAMNGRLGVKDVDVVHEPMEMALPGDAKAVAVSCGDKHTIVAALDATSHGKVFAFGASGPWLGLGDVQKDIYEPKCAFESESIVTDVSSGSRHTLFCTSDGVAYSCGIGAKGSLGQICKPYEHGEFYYMTSKDLQNVWQQDRSQYVALLIHNDDLLNLLKGAKSIDGEIASLDPSVKYMKVGNTKRIKKKIFHSSQLNSGLASLEDCNDEELDVIKARITRRFARERVLSEPEAPLATDSDLEAKVMPDVSRRHIPVEQKDQFSWIFVLPSLTNVDKPRPIDLLHGCYPQQVAAGGSHSAIKTKSGALFTFGEGLFGQLGHGLTHANNSSHVTPVPLQVSICEELIEHGVKKVVCGFRHTACITNNNKLYTWGGGASNIVGRQADDFYHPGKVDLLSSETIRDVDASIDFTVCCTSVGQTFCFGASKADKENTKANIMTLERSNHNDCTLSVAVGGGDFQYEDQGKSATFVLSLNASYLDKAMISFPMQSPKALIVKSGRELCAGVNLNNECLIL